ncbi:MAG TPA: ABC transporter ATP-binding protein [Candidatus Marinimicrobia bacterium]|nr:ABC transporter ATP-binding protein [Candidatus Neomarinimicrobiota bacterium]
MESTPVIQIQNLSKQYRLGQKVAFDTLRDRLGAFLHKNPLPLLTDQKVVRALRNLDLEVYPGEVLGIIGFNGSGKSTLLKLISRITPPTAGEIKIRGGVSSLLDVGLGFHPDLTGRENIFLNGAILGMKRTEIKAKFDDIVTFSGIEPKFLDTPVKRYSSGMYVRLAFSIAAHLDSDILLIDEVLAVGDYEFQKKCLDKIDNITQSRRTVLFVSHNLAAIERLCDRTIVIDKGQKVFDGKTAEAIEHYYSLHKRQANPDNLLDPGIVRTGTGAVRFAGVQIIDKQMQPKTEIAPDEEITIQLDLDVQKPVNHLRIAIIIKNRLGQTLAQLYSKDSRHDFGTIEKNTSILCHINHIPLNPGNYYLDLWIADRVEVLDFVEHACDLVIRRKTLVSNGKIHETQYSGNVFVECKWDW